VRARSATAALVTAVALAVTPATAVLAEDGSTGPGVTKSAEGKAKAAEAKARAKARKLDRTAGARGALVLGGRVVAVDTATGSLTFTVRGGRYKVLRGTDVTALVSPEAKVTRDGVVTLAEVQVGDHVVVKAWRFDFTLAEVPGADATAAPTVTVTMKAHRVGASPAETEAEVETEAAA